MTDRGIYPDDLADRLKARAGEKYRPSNGSEGEIFMMNYCHVCKRDAEFREGTGDSCPIAADVHCYSKDDPKYPAEWQYGHDGQPTCTAFDAE